MVTEQYDKNQRHNRWECRVTINFTPESTIEECKRHVDECIALLERTSVPEYREVLMSMAKAWMKIAQSDGAGPPDEHAP